MGLPHPPGACDRSDARPPLEPHLGALLAMQCKMCCGILCIVHVQQCFEDVLRVQHRRPHAAASLGCRGLGCREKCFFKGCWTSHRRGGDLVHHVAFHVVDKWPRYSLSCCPILCLPCITMSWDLPDPTYQYSLKLPRMLLRRRHGQLPRQPVCWSLRHHQINH